MNVARSCRKRYAGSSDVRISLLITPWALAACASSPQAEAFATSRQEIALGKAPEFRGGTVAVRGRNGDICSGVLVGEDLVLTARHCLSGAIIENPRCNTDMFQDEGVVPEDVSVTFAAHLGAETAWVHPARVEVAPGPPKVCGADLAGLVLADGATPPDVMPTNIELTVLVAPGDRYRSEGFGADPTSGLPPGDLRSRNGLRVLCEPGSCGRETGAEEFAGETGLCPGDSGGPALNDSGAVVGIAARGSKTCEQPIFTALSGWRSWLLEFASLSSFPPSWSEPSPTDPKPAMSSPPTKTEQSGCSIGPRRSSLGGAAVLLIGVLILLLKRRRHLSTGAFVLLAAGCSAPAQQPTVQDPDPVTAPNVSLGLACRTDSDCGATLTCLTADSSELVGGPPNGVCTKRCSADASVCTKLPSPAECVGIGSTRYCLPRCKMGPAAKCQGRLDMACTPIPSSTTMSCSSDADCRSLVDSGNGAFCNGTQCESVSGVCVPQCNSDADCPEARACDSYSGLCVDRAAVTNGAPVGTPCDPNAKEETCRGFCDTLAVIKGECQTSAQCPKGTCVSGSCLVDTSLCVEPCTFGAAKACGWNQDGPALAHCFYKISGTDYLTDLPARGDAGLCGQLCDCNKDCLNQDLVCAALSASDSEFLGRRGVCQTPKLDAVQLNCP